MVEGVADMYLNDLDDPVRLAALTQAQQAVTLAWALRWRVANDGFEGWAESYGPITDLAARGLDAMGATAYARIVAEVARWAPAVAEDHPENDEMYEAVARLRTLSEQFFDLVKEDDLIENYVAPFVLTRREDFPLTVEDL